jgi:hypothetical protein
MSWQPILFGGGGGQPLKIFIKPQSSLNQQPRRHTMIIEYYKNDLLVTEALALLFGLNLRQFRRNEGDLLDILKSDVWDCRQNLKMATQIGDTEAITAITLAQQEAIQEVERIGELRIKLVGEIDKARMDKPTLILIVKDDLPGDNEHDFVRISKQSLYDWAEHAKIKVGSAPPPPTRKHTTPLLELLDELIGEFWEGYDGGPLPSGTLITAWVKEKYGHTEGDTPKAKGTYGFPDLSNTVMKAMVTMMRPPELRNKR